MVKPANKSKQRRNEILQASQELFNKKGFQGTSINDIMLICISGYWSGWLKNFLLLLLNWSNRV